MVEAVGPQGDRVQAFLKSPKLSAKKSAKCLEREWMCAGLASELGLPCARPALLEVPRQLIAALDDEGLREALDNGPEILFGSTRAPNGYALWSSASTMPARLGETLAGTYLFDTTVQNWDRSIANPNLLTDGANIFLFDHDEAFARATAEEEEAAAARPPWRPGGIGNHFEGTSQHVLWRHARKCDEEVYRSLAERWKGVTNETYDKLVHAMPACWDRKAGFDIVEYLLEARENVDSVIEHILHNIQK